MSKKTKETIREIEEDGEVVLGRAVAIPILVLTAILQDLYSSLPWKKRKQTRRKMWQKVERRTTRNI